MFGIKNRDSLPDVVLDEFEWLAAKLRNFLLNEHNPDGTHIESTESSASVSASGIPIGAMMPYGGTTAPTDWVLCDGSPLNRVAYLTLFSVLGTTYGVGDGSTTFNVPDLRGKFPLGKATAGTGSTLGGTGGAIDHTHSFAHTPTSSSDGAHDHGGVTGAPSATTTVDNDLALSTVAVGSATHTHTITSGGAHTHTVAVSGTTGTGNPPFQAVNYIMRAA